MIFCLKCRCVEAEIAISFTEAILEARKAKPHTIITVKDIFINSVAKYKWWSEFIKKLERKGFYLEACGLREHGNLRGLKRLVD